jgi:hypothetical protein
MRRYPVTSSNIAGIGWENDVLEVEFRSGGVYQYTGVTQSAYFNLINASSVGRAFHQGIKDKYTEQRIE